jgi:uncharacterized protein (DUF305 family)
MKRLVLLALVLLTGLLLSACADQPDGAAGTGAPDVGAEHNEADVRFASEMIPHHRQGVQMAEMAVERGTPEVSDLAARMAEVQEEEIETMSEWLRSWDEDVPEGTAMGGHGGHGGGGMGGTMSPEDMGRLGGMSGADFDRMWLNGMIEHHRGAIEMSETQLDEGSFGPARELAATIAEEQEAEIEKMNELLARL